MQYRRLPLFAVGISFVFWLGLYFGAWWMGWPGEAHPCSDPPYCFCETVKSGAIAAQPSNTWSDLGFVLAAIFMAFHGSRWLKNRQPLPSSAPAYKDSPVLISLYVAVILYMGPGSMFFHGGMRQWGGWLDVISMYLFVNYVIAYLVYRSWGLKPLAFFGLYTVLSLFFIWLAVFMHDLSSKVFPLLAAILVTLALLQLISKEQLSLARTRDLGLQHKWLGFALAFFITAVVIWRLSDTGMALCYPDSLLQGHAAWHLLSACMTVCIHYYFLSESETKTTKA